MTMLIGTTHAQQIIDLSVDRSLWAALFTEMPTLVNPLASEIAGGGYARPAVTMQRSARRLVNVNALVFPGVPAGLMVAVGLFTAAVNGELWLATSFSPKIATPGGKSLVLEPGDIAFAV